MHFMAGERKYPREAGLPFYKARIPKQLGMRVDGDKGMEPLGDTIRTVALPF